jgi:hypothetical protein
MTDAIAIMSKNTLTLRIMDFSFIVCGTWKLQFQLSNAAEIRLLRRAGVSALPESPVDFKSDHYFTPISTPCEYEKKSEKVCTVRLRIRIGLR